MNVAISHSETRSRLTMDSYDQFSGKIRQEFIEGSGIAPSLFDTAIEIHSDVEAAPGGEARYPIHETLNWKKVTRFGKQARKTMQGAFFQNIDGSTWQIKLSDPLWDHKKGKYRKYESPAGGGSKPYFPQVPQNIIDGIAQQYGLQPPTPDKFWDWAIAHREIPIIITEGGKKGLCLLSHGYLGIALYGVTGGYRVKDAEGNRIPRQLIPELLPFLRDRKVILAFDQDEKPKTRKDVAIALTRLSILMKKAGASVHIAFWENKDGKGIDDFTVANGTNALDLIIREAMSFKEWQIANRLWSRLTLDPTLQIEQADLDKVEINNLPKSGIIAIASAKGTGKTKHIAKLVKQSQKALLACHRIALSRNLCHRLGLDYRGDIDKANGEFITGSSYTLRVGFCVDSLLSIDPSKFAGCDLVIDEVCQVLRHLLTSATCNKDGRRPALLARFRQLIESANRVIVADADLDNDALFYLQSLREEDQKIFLLKNTYQSEGYPCSFIQANDRTPIIDDLLKAIKHQTEGKIFYVTTDSKGLSKTLFQLIEQVHPDKRILLINAETSGGDFEQEFIQNPDEVLTRNEYDVVICSPSVATGTSIESQDKVQAVYGIFMGVSLNDADISQSLSRVRESVPRVIWCAQRGRNYCKVSRSTNPIELKGHLFERTGVTTALIRSSLKQDTQSLLETYDWQTDPHIHLFAKISANQNWAMANLREAVKVRLQVEGNTIVVLNTIANPTLRTQVKEAQKRQKLSEANAVLNAEEINLVEAKALEQKEGLSLEESLALTKFHLKDFYCVEELTLELIQFDREGRGRGELLNLEAQIHRDLAIDRTAKALEKQASWKQHLCPWDIPGTALRREFREKLGLQDFILEAITGAEWSAEELEGLANQLLDKAALIRAHLGITINAKMSPAQIVHQMCAQLGLKFSFRWSNNYPGRESEKVRVYSLDKENWEFCCAIIERRALMRQAQENQSKEGCCEGSPYQINELNSEGDPSESPFPMGIPQFQQQIDLKGTSPKEEVWKMQTLATIFSKQFSINEHSSS